MRIESELSHLAKFSLFERDLVNRIFALSGLRARPLGALLARIVILWFLTWIPLALLAVLSGVGIGRPPRENFFLDVAAYGQFILGLPLFVIAESVISVHTREAAKSFLASGVIKLQDLAQADELHRQIEHLRKLILPEIIALALAYAFTFAWIHEELHNAVETWHGLGPPYHQSLTWAGWWEVLVAVPLLNYWWLRWIWKISLWCWYLARISRFRLTLVASHPDSTGGLGFLSEAQTKFGLAILAFGVSIVAASVGYKLSIERASFDVFAVWGPLVGFIVGAPILFTAPLFMFTKQLYRTKRRAVKLYHERAMQVALSFEEKWLHASSEGERHALDSGDVTEFNYISHVYDRIQKMRVVPFDTRSFAELIASALGPILPLLPYFVDVPAPLLKVLEEGRKMLH